MIGSAFACLAFALAGCGGGGTRDESQPTATATAETTSGPDLAALSDEYGSTLDAPQGACEFPGADSVACRDVLAAGVDATNAVADALAVEARAAMSPTDDVLDAVDQVREAYDTYTDDGNCFSLELQSIAGLPLGGVDQTLLMTCQVQANTAALRMASVGASLRSA